MTVTLSTTAWAASVSSLMPARCASSSLSLMPSLSPCSSPLAAAFSGTGLASASGLPPPHALSVRAAASSIARAAGRGVGCCSWVGSSGIPAGSGFERKTRGLQVGQRLDEVAAGVERLAVDDDEFEQADLAGAL